MRDAPDAPQPATRAKLHRKYKKMAGTRLLYLRSHLLPKMPV